MVRLRQMLKTTAVRLTLVYTLLFGLLAAGVVIYVSYNTGRLLLSQIQTTVDEEVQQISDQLQLNGIRVLIPIIERRSRRPGANLYLVSDANGRIIAGNVRELDRSLLADEGWRLPPFDYLRFADENAQGKAIARVFPLPGGLRLLIGRDIGDAERFRSVVLRATTLSLGVMVLTGLLLWFFVGRRALKHIDSVNDSSQRIVAGDLSQRLPLSGSGDEFDRLSQSLNEMIARVEKLNFGITTMSDSIAHDLKTPLTRLRNRAESALDKNADSDDLEKIVVEADALIRTFDALLMISQVESGARPARLEISDIRPVVQSVFELFEPNAEEMDVKLSLGMEPCPPFKCNTELLAQALTNLLDNALKYGVGAKDAEIKIKLCSTKTHAILSVSDNGPGIPKESMSSVTDRFVRLEPSRSKPGSGLGLSLVNATVKLHSGELKLSDNFPGLNVEIILPFA